MMPARTRARRSRSATVTRRTTTAETFSISVGGVNQAPVLAAIGNQSVDEGATLNVPLSASDADTGDTLTFTASGLPSFCSLTDTTGPTGNLQCTPGFDDAGTYPGATVTVSDGNPADNDCGDLQHQRRWCQPGTGTGRHWQPVGGRGCHAERAAVSERCGYWRYADVYRERSAELLQPDGQPPVRPATCSAHRALMMPARTPARRSRSATATRRTTTAETFSISVGGVNQAPVLAAIGNQSVDEGATLNVPLSASDADTGDTLTFTASGLPSFCSLTDSHRSDRQPAVHTGL